MIHLYGRYLPTNIDTDYRYIWRYTSDASPDPSASFDVFRFIFRYIFG